MYVQHQTTDYKRKKDYKHILQKYWQFLKTLPMILDLLDNQNCYTILYVRCRHNLITTITATRICTANNKIIRLNATELWIWQITENTDLDNFYRCGVTRHWKQLPHQFNYNIQQHMLHMHSTCKNEHLSWKQEYIVYRVCVNTC